MKNKLLVGIALLTLAIGGIADATALTQNQKDFIKIALPDKTLSDEVALRLDAVDDSPVTATFAIGTISGDNIDIGVQFKSENGVAISHYYVTTCWLSEASTGAALATTAASAAFSTQTNGLLLKSDTSGLLGRFLTNSTGLVTIRVTQSSNTNPSDYLACTTAGRSVAVSGVFTHH